MLDLSARTVRLGLITATAVAVQAWVPRLRGGAGEQP